MLTVVQSTYEVKVLVKHRDTDTKTDVFVCTDIHNGARLSSNKTDSYFIIIVY